MKYFFKIFFISLTAFSIVGAVGIFVYVRNHSFESEYNKAWATANMPDGGSERNESIAGSQRINVLVVGLESTRTDTIMLATYDKKDKKAAVISVPRDTHYARDDMMYTGSNKINAINSVKGMDGLRGKIEEILGIPVNNYIALDYDGVKAAVDAIGGVEMDIPFHMKYDDPRATPPFHVDLPPGVRVLNGDEAIGFLRFRQGNPGYPSYPDGDLGRIKAQQEFVKSAAKKAIGPSLPDAVSSVFPYVETDFTLPEALSLAMNLIDMDTGNISFHRLPGDAQSINEGSFYIYDEAGIEDLIDEIYGLEKNGSDENKNEDGAIDQ